VAFVAWGQASSGRRLRTGERLKMLPKRGEFAPFAEDALQWNQALEPLQAGQVHPVLLTFSASRNCSRSDYPARGADDDSEGGRKPAQRHENKGEDCSPGGVMAETRRAFGKPTQFRLSRFFPSDPHGDRTKYEVNLASALVLKSLNNGKVLPRWTIRDRSGSRRLGPKSSEPLRCIVSAEHPSHVAEHQLHPVGLRERHARPEPESLCATMCMRSFRLVAISGRH
jgi:hypothetical protein